MKLDDRDLKDSELELAEEWIAKKAFIEDDRCEIAQECVLTCNDFEEEVQLFLIRDDGQKTVQATLEYQEFKDMSIEVFNEYLYHLSKTHKKGPRQTG